MELDPNIPIPSVDENTFDLDLPLHSPKPSPRKRFNDFDEHLPPKIARSDSLNEEAYRLATEPPTLSRSNSLELFDEPHTHAEEIEGKLFILRANQKYIKEELLKQFQDGNIPYPKINISNGIQTTIELYTDNKQLENMAFEIEKIGNATFKLDQYELHDLRDDILDEVENHQLNERDKLCVDLYDDISIAETFITDSITDSDFIILVKIGKKIIGLCCGNYDSKKRYQTTTGPGITPLVYIELLCGTNSFSLVGTIIIRFLKQIVALTAREKGSITINDSILLKSIDDPDTESFYANTSDFIKFDIANTRFAGYIWFLNADVLHFKSLTEDSIIPYAKPTIATRLQEKRQSREDYERRIGNDAVMIRKSDVSKQWVSPPPSLVRADTISIMNVDDEIKKILKTKFNKLLKKLYNENSEKIRELSENRDRLKHGGTRRRMRKSRKSRKLRKLRNLHLLKP